MLEVSLWKPDVIQHFTIVCAYQTGDRIALDTVLALYLQSLLSLQREEFVESFLFPHHIQNLEFPGASVLVFHE